MTVPVYARHPGRWRRPQNRPIMSGLVCAFFAASAAGGPGRGASQTGDHGGAQRGHRGARTARSSANRVYTSYSLFPLRLGLGGSVP